MQMSMREDKNSEQSTKAKSGFMLTPACSEAIVKVTIVEEVSFAKKQLQKIWSALHAARGESVEKVYKIVALLRKPLRLDISQRGKPYIQIQQNAPERGHRGPNSSNTP